MDTAAHLDLADVVPEDVIFGEIDVVGSVAIMATAWPEAGFIVFDVSDPSQPVVLSRFHGPPCEEAILDVICGTDVKLSPDGKTVFMATERGYREPRVPGKPQAATALFEPGIVVVNLEDPRAPTFESFLPVEAWGVHMHAFHEVDGVGYLFMIDNTVGLQIARLEHVAGRKVLVPVFLATEPLFTHDVFLYDDPVDDTTYLYVAAAWDGMKVFDVGDPAQPILVGTWDLPWWGTEELYAHSVATIRRGERRFTYVVPEMWAGGGGNQVGPIWLVDTTDHAAPFLAGTWTNPGGRRAGNFGFSPHNISLAADGHLWLAHYHGGVWLLDWRPVLDHAGTRPLEVGYLVPSQAYRPYIDPNPRFGSFLKSTEVLRRPSIWDVADLGDSVLASDITGGFYVLRRSA